MKDHPSVTRYARSFAPAMPGRSAEDVLEEAREGYEKACIAAAKGKYDPRRASWDTYATTAVYRHMCTARKKSQRRVLTISMGEGWDFEDKSPAPDRGLLLWELIRELPRDARAMVELALGDAGRASSKVDACLREGTEEAAGRARDALWGTVSHPRRRHYAEAAFRAVRDMLGELAG